MGVERQEQRKILPQKYQGSIGRARFAIDYSVRVASLVTKVAIQGYDSPIIAKPEVTKQEINEHKGS